MVWKMSKSLDICPAQALSGVFDSVASMFPNMVTVACLRLDKKARTLIATKAARDRVREQHQYSCESLGISQLLPR